MRPAEGADELARAWARLMRLQVELAFPVEVPFFVSCDDWLSARRVLDVGCGTGDYLAALRRQFPDKRYVGVDCEARYVTLAETLLQSAPPTADVTVERGDLVDVTGEFDAVVARLLVQHLEHPEQVFEAADRLLAPGGTLIVIDSLDAERRFFPAVPEVEAIFATFRNARRRAGRDRDAGLHLTARAKDHGFALHHERTVIAPSSFGERTPLFLETYLTVFSILQLDFDVAADFAAATAALERWHATPGAYAHIGVHLACYRRASAA
jgi:SAM-dependent methyltransferase